MPIVPLVLISIATSLMLAATFIFYTILGEVNGTRKTHEQISMLFVNARVGEILKLHKGSFPDSKKRNWFYAMMVASFVVGFIAFLFAR